jgi:hypothetical protein
MELPSGLKLTEALFKKLDQEVVLSFNGTINLLNIQSFILTVKQGGIADKLIIPKRISLDESKTKIIFKFEFDFGMENATIEIANKEGELTVQSHSSNWIYYTDFPVEVKNVNYFNSAATESIESIGSIGSKITTGLTIGLVVVSFPLALTLIKLIQMIDFLLFINVELPVNTQAFLSLFDQNVMKMFPNPFEINEARIKCIPHRIFSKEDMSCSMLNNMGEQLLQILVLLFGKGLFLIFTLAT